MSNLKKCSRCKLEKDPSLGFYHSKGKIRGECKACTKAKNIAYQRKKEVWKNRTIDPEKQRSYMLEYYKKNRERFAEYRERFRKKFPNYYRDYARKRKLEKVTCLMK